MTPLTMYVVLYLAPAILLIIYRVWRVNRKAAQAEREALPFDPKPEAAANLLLSRFPLPERTYLRQQLTTAMFGYSMATWFFTMIFTISLVPLPAGRHTTWTDPGAYTWFRYVESAVSGSPLCLVFCSFAAMLVVLPMRQSPDAQFHRTRPISMSFLFWARVLPVLGAVIASPLTGGAVSFLLLALIKGPVWQHLPSSFPGIVTPGDDRPQDYSALLATSVPRVFLSLCTTVVMLFSAFAVLFTIPVNSWGRRISSSLRSLPPLFAAMIAAWTVFALDMLDILHLPRRLFFYTHLGPPPPYVFIVFPILIAGSLLGIARYFTSRLELEP